MPKISSPSHSQVENGFASRQALSSVGPLRAFMWVLDVLHWVLWACDYVVRLTLRVLSGLFIGPASRGDVWVCCGLCDGGVCWSGLCGCGCGCLCSRVPLRPMSYSFVSVISSALVPPSSLLCESSRLLYEVNADLASPINLA